MGRSPRLGAIVDCGSGCRAAFSTANCHTQIQRNEIDLRPQTCLKQVKNANLQSTTAVCQVSQCCVKYSPASKPLPNLPVLVMPSQVPPLSLSWPARMSESSHQSASAVGLRRSCNISQQVSGRVQTPYVLKVTYTSIFMIVASPIEKFVPVERQYKQ